MLSKKSEQFMIELRMYLMSKGKSDKQINEITAELEDHLHQAEAAGNGIVSITGDSPKEYMKSIGQELDTDLRQYGILAPFGALLLLAYFSFVPAIKGTFSLTELGMWASALTVALSVFVYGFLLFKVLPKLYHSKWFYGMMIGAYVLLTGIFVIIELENAFGSRTFFRCNTTGK